MYKYSDGELRLFMLLGLLIGLSVYILTLSRYFIKVSVLVIKIVKTILGFPLKIVYKITRKLIFRPISLIYINVRKNFVKKFKKITKKRGFFVKKEKYIIER